jgi:phage gp29-like protein
MTLHEAAGKSGTVDLYERFLDNCNDEMSIAVLGNTLTTKSDTNGTQALGTVQAKEQMKITEDDIQFILDLLNYDMTDIFAALGVNTENGEFVRVEPKYQDKQVQINVVSKLKEMGLPMSDDYLYQTFDVEKPDDYDARKAAIEAERAAQAERAQQLADRLNQEPTNAEKRKFLDRFRSFFGLAPQGGASQDEPLPFL